MTRQTSRTKTSFWASRTVHYSFIRNFSQAFFVVAFCASFFLMDGQVMKGNSVFFFAQCQTTAASSSEGDFNFMHSSSSQIHYPIKVNFIPISL